MSAHFASRQNVVLTPVDDVERHAQALHQRGAGAEQVVRRPWACPVCAEYRCRLGVGRAWAYSPAATLHVDISVIFAQPH